ncbi:MAG TPA: hypothetical protein VM450_19400 [Thermomicrobiales bacterium]|jgi:hypothetical protein|nr:hypothetical protein [Thermomicrobiales bacterium]
MSLQNAPFISAIAALIGAFVVMLLAGTSVIQAVVIAVLVAVVAYLVTSWQTRRIER